MTALAQCVETPIKLAGPEFCIILLPRDTILLVPRRKKHNSPLCANEVADDTKLGSTVNTEKQQNIMQEALNGIKD
ncbi:hypothetical protein Y1Q_0000038 [Alligator mississippiensis]|uniref:Uncharacterized protein n=1 Tax=Alligator mississippiensis TaxID=8496 RepID=A0A151NU61_ALLMI|nr:hypothetical protein Y1Q_0000038 [Alligator mississippiensis]